MQAGDKFWIQSLVILVVAIYSIALQIAALRIMWNVQSVELRVLECNMTWIADQVFLYVVC